MSILGPIRRALLAGIRWWPIRGAALALIAVAGLAAALIVVLEAFVVPNWADALSYAEGARRFLASSSPYSEMQLAGPYALDDAAWGRGFVYPPTSAVLLVAFALGEFVFYFWNALSVAALLAVVLLVVRREWGGLPWQLAMTAAALTLLHPGLAELRAGYLSPMVAAGVGLAWLSPRWSAFPALLMGLVKVYPAAGILWTARKRGFVAAPLLVAALFALTVVLLNPGYWVDWLTALANARPGCPDYALPSFPCSHLPILGYLTSALLMAAAWRVRRDDVAFALLGLAMTTPLPDIYWGNLLVPTVAVLPLVLHEVRKRLTRRVMEPGAHCYPASAAATRSASSIE